MKTFKQFLLEELRKKYKLPTTHPMIKNYHELDDETLNKIASHVWKYNETHKTPTPREIPHKGTYITQRWLKNDGNDNTSDDGRMHPTHTRPTIVLYKGKRLWMDGHHRLAIDIIHNKKTSTKAHYYEIDD